MKLVRFPLLETTALHFPPLPLTLQSRNVQHKYYYLVNLNGRKGFPLVGTTLLTTGPLGMRI